jgi:hypothetical protein
MYIYIDIVGLVSFPLYFQTASQLWILKNWIVTSLRRPTFDRNADHWDFDERNSIFLESPNIVVCRKIMENPLLFSSVIFQLLISVYRGFFTVFFFFPLSTKRCLPLANCLRKLGKPTRQLRNQWPFQVPNLEVATIYQVYVRARGYTMIYPYIPS